MHFKHSGKATHASVNATIGGDAAHFCAIRFRWKRFITKNQITSVRYEGCRNPWALGETNFRLIQTLLRMSSACINGSISRRFWWDPPSIAKWQIGWNRWYQRIPREQEADNTAADRSNGRNEHDL